ncbi:hypothetical protein LMG23992_02246 [Cupriavidus laharis]|uniref:Uncharacterized protein n=1 Tax=Cupriavidus laharis TaxID=151654 RepID=A0ABN7YGA2_9BURK|nr:hypothetical protein [Cupriavidus laharis]CAG9172479.1 hypothetical protein LMG23992_02246 [Cupriavidus laharis]
MRFTEYVVLERAAQATDPLGFRRPGGALQDLLFPQFTVLTLHPAYLSALCCFLLQLQDRPNQAKFARDFRELELLWGIGNASVETSIINVTKYRELCGDDIRLGKIPARHPIFARLSYGTLGHYSSVAMRWNLTDKSGRNVSRHGRALGEGFAGRRRSGPTLDEQLQAWTRDEVITMEQVGEIGRSFGIQAEASARERQTWQDVIDDWCRRVPDTAVLWRRPLDPSLMPAQAQDAASYRQVFPKLEAFYPELIPELGAMYRFERLAAATQFVFELHLAALELGDKFADAGPSEPDAFAALVVDTAQDYVRAGSRFHDARNLFMSIARGKPTYAALKRCIIDHHKEHQSAKGTSAIVDHDKFLVSGRVEPKTMQDALDDIAGVGDMTECLDRLQSRYRRDWHFDKCRRWHDWADGKQEVQA